MLTEDDLGELTLYDIDRDRAHYLARDLRDTALERQYSTRVHFAENLGELHGSDIVIISAGRGYLPQEDAATLFRENSGVVDAVAKSFVGSSAIFVVATEPVDLMTTAIGEALKIPPSRVLGLGGLVDSYRLRYLISETIGTSPKYIQAQVIGPHDEDAKIIWEFCSVNGISILELTTEEQRNEIAARFAQNDMSTDNSPSRYAPAVACLELLRTIVKPGRNVHTVTLRWGPNRGMPEGAMSVPVLVGQVGAEHPIVPKLSEAFRSLLEKRTREQAAVLAQGGMA